MKRFFKSRTLALALVFSLLFMTIRCGFILYPERRGREPGELEKIDPVVLIMDCAWLLVFVIPGIAALAVDAVTGGLYLTDNKKSINLNPGQRLAFRLNGEAPVDAIIEVAIKSQEDGESENLFIKSLERGEEVKNQITFRIPSDIKAGDYDLLLTVNGVANACWNLNIEE